MLWDTGSTLTFVTFDKAKEMNLRGRPVKLSIVVVGGQTEAIESEVFNIKIVKGDGSFIDIQAYGIESISSTIQPTDVGKIARIFGINPSEIQRSVNGQIDVLIGQQYAALHPTRWKSRGHLLLMKNDFGLVVTGCDPDISTSSNISPSCLKARIATVMHAVKGIESFFEIEGLGVVCQPKCGGCKCGKCQPGGQNMSLKDEREYKMIEGGSSLTMKQEDGLPATHG